MSRTGRKAEHILKTCFSTISLVIAGQCAGQSVMHMHSSKKTPGSGALFTKDPPVPVYRVCLIVRMTAIP
jgi:hypothetical protein